MAEPILSNSAALRAADIDFSDTAKAFAHKTNGEMQRTYWLFKLMNNPGLVKTGGNLLNWALSWHMPVGWAVKATVFKQFCGGEDIEQCKATIKTLGKYHVGAILDYSVEGEKTDKVFDKTCEEIIETIHTASQVKNIPFSVFKVTGVGNFDLLAKIHAKEPLTTEEEKAWQRVKDRVNRICQTAADRQVRIFFDGEETWIQDTIDQLCYDNMARYNRLMPIVYNTYQMYRRAALDNLKRDITTAQANGYYFGAKIVRGAYMEKERARAEKFGYPDPIQPDKNASDRDYDAAVSYCLEHLDIVSICAGTHNENSCKLLALEMEKRGIAIDDERIYFSQLLGMSDNISFVLAQRGYNVAKYVPYGPVAAVMPYLLRRAQENTSIAGQSSREFLLIAKEMQRRKA